MKKSLIPVFLFLLLFAASFAQQKNLSINDLSNRKLSPKTLHNIQWVPGKTSFSFQSSDVLVLCSAEKDKRDTLLRLNDINTRLSTFVPDPLKAFPAIRWEKAGLFTFISKNALYRYDIGKKTLEQLNRWDETAENLDIDYNTFTAAYTRGNNLFLCRNNKEIYITDDKNTGIVNGSERVHRNEWGIEKGTFWSPAGNYIAYYRMDETMVADYPLVNIDTRIATPENTKYPMAGEKSHEVTVGVYSLSTGNKIFLKTGEPRDQFLTNIAWSPDEKYIFIAVLNRGQDHLWLKQYDARTGDFIQTLFEETSERYVEPMHPIVFLKKDPQQFVWQSRRDGWNHLYLYNLSGKLLKQLTQGEWEVIELLEQETSGEELLYASTMQSPLEVQYYSVSLKSGKISRLTDTHGSHHLYPQETGKFFVDACNSIEMAGQYSVKNSKGKTAYILQIDENPLADYKLGETSISTLKAVDGSLLYYRMIKPVDFDPAKKYPVIIYVYGGPHAQLITDSWLSGAGLYLNTLASKGYIVFTLDNRGSEHRGFAFESAIYRQVGKVEMEDQMTGVEYLKSLPYVDVTRIGINGWSYGGFLTMSLMLRNPGVFKVAVAGGPVTDWKFYEVMYGERYMDTPQENPEGYEDANLMNYAGRLKGKLLIIQGYQDGTVVPQNCLSFLKKSVDEGVQVDFFLYPGHEHNVRGKDRLHLYEKMTGYFDQNL